MSSTGGSLPVLSFGSIRTPSDDELPVYGSTVDDLIAESDPDARPPINLQHLAQTVLKAKKIAVVCGKHRTNSHMPCGSVILTPRLVHPTGAGISVASGIPDFRSETGLFATLKKQYPEAKLASGKDLFDASLFAVSNSPSLDHAHPLSSPSSWRRANRTLRSTTR